MEYEFTCECGTVVQYVAARRDYAQICNACWERRYTRPCVECGQDQATSEACDYGVCGYQESTCAGCGDSCDFGERWCDYCAGGSFSYNAIHGDW